MRRPSQALLDVLVHLLIGNAYPANRFPRELLMDQELRLSSSPMFVTRRPIFCLHDLPVYFSQVVQVVKKF